MLERSQWIESSVSLFLIKVHQVSKILNYVAQFLYNPIRVTKPSISERCQVRTDKPLWCRHFQSSMSLRCGIILDKIQILFFLPCLKGTAYHEQIKAKVFTCDFVLFLISHSLVKYLFTFFF